MTESARKTRFIVILASIIIVIIGLIVYIKAKYINELYKSIDDINYGGVYIINTEKYYSKQPYIYYFKDLNYNNTTNTDKKPIRLIKYKINTSSRLSVVKIDYWSYKKFGLLESELNTLPKHKKQDDCRDCIKIKDYKETYYTDVLDANLILSKYFSN